jgi:hypothetical protein
MSILTPAYRLTVYAPRSVDPTESTVLTPRAGSAHSDPFKIATVQGVTGFQPYLNSLPMGRRSRIDPLKKTTDIGSLTFKLGDKMLTDNAHRWVTAFTGDTAGELVLTGRLIVVEESLDFAPTSPGTATWTRYFTGRIVQPQLADRLNFQLTANEMTDDLSVNVFVGSPASTVSSYAFQSHLYPLGLLQAYGPFPVVAKAKGHIAAPQLAGYDAFSLTVDKDQPNPERLIAPRVLIDGLLSPQPSFKTHLVITRLDDSTTTEWELPRAINWSTSLEKLAAAQVTGATPATVPPNGTAVEFYIKPMKYAVSETLPLLINDVHPVTFIRHLLSGAYGILDASGNPTWSIGTDSASFAALEADPSFPTWRSFETAIAKLNDTVEAVCRHANLAYYPNEFGQIVICDLRRSSLITPVGTLTSADMDTGSVPTWAPDATQAVSSIQITYHVEQQIADSDLPKPFQQLPAFEQARDHAPDIAPVKITEPYDEVLETLQAGSRVGDVKGNTEQFDDRGARYGLTGPPSPNGQPSVVETLDGQARPLVVQNQLAAVASELRAPYALGPVAMSVSYKRAAASGFTTGKWCVVQVDEIPDAASNTRGGARLALITGRTENGPTVQLDLLDAGANAVAVTPTIGTPTSPGANTLNDSVTLNAAGDPVLFMVAITDTGTVTRPADTSALWKFSPAPITASGTAVVDKLPSGGRAWVRARSFPGGGAGFKLPSAWVYPSGTGYVDLPGIAAITGLAGTDDSGDFDLTWTPGDSINRIEIFLTTGATMPTTFLDILRLTRLEAGSTHFALGPLVLGQQYTVGVRAFDGYGGVGPMATLTFTQASSPALDDPVFPTAFACSTNSNGFVLDGTYGLAVIAAEVPGYVEFQEELETGVGTGSYGPATTIGRAVAMLGDWTKIVRVAPNDGLRRRMSARSILDPAAPSGYTDPVDVTPWKPLGLGPIPTTLAVEVTVLPASPPTDEGLRLHFQVACVDPLGSVCQVEIFDLSSGSSVNSGPAVGTLAANDTQWKVNLPAAGSSPALMTVRGVSPDGRTADKIVVLPAAQLVNAQCIAHMASASDTQITVTVDANNPTGTTPQVELVSITGDATVASGASIGVLVAAGSSWVFNRGATSSPPSQARFRATGAGYIDDDDLIVIPQKGAGTMELSVVASVQANAQLQMTVRVTVNDAVPQAGSYITIDAPALTHIPSITPNTPQTVANGGFVDYVIDRPDFGTGVGGVTWTAHAANRVDDSDVITVTEKPRDTIPGRLTISKAQYNSGTGKMQVWFRLFETTSAGVENEMTSQAIWVGGGADHTLTAIAKDVATGSSVLPTFNPGSFPGTNNYDTGVPGWLLEWTATAAQSWLLTLEVEKIFLWTGTALSPMPVLSLSIAIPGAGGGTTTVDAGTTTTGAAGTSASVSNVGTTTNAVFNFTIPRGNTGATGPTGPSGTNGTNGTNGSQWYAGSGAPGSPGPGVDNDFYLDVLTGNVYKKISGTYTLEGNIKGATGPNYPVTVSTSPASGTGSTGQLWIQYS